MELIYAYQQINKTSIDYSCAKAPCPDIHVFA